MGFGRFNSICKKLHKRKRTVAVAPQARQQEESPNFDAWAAERETAAAGSAHHRGWNESLAENDHYGRRCSDNDDDDYAASTHGSDDEDDEDNGGLSSMSCGDGLSEARIRYAQSREDHGDGDHDGRLRFDEDERVSMELDTEVDDSHYCLLASSSAGGSFRHSSGRPTLRQETTLGATRHTIEYEFEEYFAALLLK